MPELRISDAERDALENAILDSFGACRCVPHDGYVCAGCRFLTEPRRLALLLWARREHLTFLREEGLVEAASGDSLPW